MTTSNRDKYMLAKVHPQYQLTKNLSLQLVF